MYVPHAETHEKTASKTAEFLPKKEATGLGSRSRQRQKNRPRRSTPRYQPSMVDAAVDMAGISVRGARYDISVRANPDQLMLRLAEHGGDQAWSGAFNSRCAPTAHLEHFPRRQ